MRRTAFIILIALMFGLTAANAETAFTTEKHTKYTLYVGLNDGNTGIQAHSTREAKRIMIGISGKYTDGFTIYEADGFWREDNKVFSEHTLICIFVDANPESIKQIMDEAMKALNQRSILLEVEDVKSTFYSGGNN